MLTLIFDLAINISAIMRRVTGSTCSIVLSAAGCKQDQHRHQGITSKSTTILILIRTNAIRMVTAVPLRPMFRSKSTSASGTAQHDRRHHEVNSSFSMFLYYEFDV